MVELVTPGLLIGASPVIGSTPAGSYANTIILMPLDGSDGDSSNFNDSSTLGYDYRHTSTELDTAEKKFGTASLLFDTGTTPHVASFGDTLADQRLAAAEFCCEAWVRYKSGPDFSAGNHCIGSQWNTNSNLRVWQFLMTGDKKLKLLYSTDGSAELSVTSAALTFNADTWYHVACTRDGNTIRLFLNGVNVKEVDIGAVTFFDTNQLLGIGSARGSAWFNAWGSVTGGWIDDYRLIKGEPVYTGNFTPPTSAHPTS